MTYLGLCFPLPLWDSFPNKVEVFFIEKLFLFALGPTALLLLATLAIFQVVVFFLLLIFIDNETFPNLRLRDGEYCTRP
jgi:hypothetical protein